jgi:hypothetical protein
MPQERVAKILSELKHGHWIRSEKQRITILRPELWAEVGDGVTG